MILLCGIPSETPVAMVASALLERGADFRYFNQRDFASYEIDVNVGNNGVAGQLQLGSELLSLDEIDSVFLRLMDDRSLPEVVPEPPDGPLRRHCRELHDQLVQWTEVTDSTVLNRHSAMGSNGSKPFQAQTIVRHGFSTPETLVTNDPAMALAFRERHGRVIFKSVSGVRSIVNELDSAMEERLDLLPACPTQFQQLVAGRDVRVHVVGRSVFPTEIVSDGVDYRYSHANGGDGAELRAIDLPKPIADRCINLAHDLGLAFAGIDLMVGDDGRIYCLEANPSPAFSYYEQHTGQPIAQAVAGLLVGDSENLPV